MYKKILLALSFSAVSMNALAAESPFVGPYVGAAVSMLSTDVDIKTSAGTFKFNGDGNTAGYGLSLGYGALSDSFYGAVEAAYRFNYGEAKISATNVKTEIKSGWELSFLPGYLVDSTTLVYGRIGMGSVDGELSLGSDSISKDLDTMIWGAGLQKAFTSQLSAKLEYNRTSMNKKFNDSDIEVDGESSGISLGVQYRF